MKRTACLSFVVFSLLSGATARGACLAYEPGSVTLLGKVELADAYGPPGYGEDPAHDAKERYPVLLLDSAICVTGDPKDAINSESEDNVRQVQLVFLDGKVWMDLLHKRGSVSGKLFHQHTGHHHTAILIQVLSAQSQ